MDQVADLPPLAIVTFGAVLAVIFGVRYLGLAQGGSSRTNPPTGAAQVAAVIVDPKALNEAAAEVSGLSVAVHSLTEQVKRTADEIDALREEMRVQGAGGVRNS
ncbi:hypothetical protein PSQ19_05950 [Devosia algicola]|uniref:DUF2746 domain-containing protein n=1 Tax=Devosia algicola TaxID=3026418 RepID=A0ABY7YRC7_9HYPH|nr:hypothetical protein [Devosia algicola]WDR03610.1 hypothetical protein PSQ19_05950 [Devosia algicola]